MASNANLSSYGNYAATPRREKRRERVDTANWKRIDMKKESYFIGSPIMYFIVVWGEKYIRKTWSSAIGTLCKN